jgi:hypothetical protein
VNIHTANSGNAEEVWPKPLENLNGQDQIRGRSAKTIEKPEIVHIVNLEPGDSV